MLRKTETTTRESGRRGETVACQYLQKEGYRIVCRNYTTMHGEIDIVAEDDRYLVFIEVKLRSADPQVRARYGRPALAVNARKREHIRYAVQCYLKANRTTKGKRIDILELYEEKIPESDVFSVKIKHYKNAFGE